MARVGELLVAAGWITIDQCVQALHAQVLWGARLGTNLIELGFVDLDQLARVLGRQHHGPAALSHHFAAADRQLQRELPVDLAERYQCIPLSRAKEGRVVVGAVAPLDERGRALVANALDARPDELVVAFAAELRIRYQLEKVYQIGRDTRFLRVRGPVHAQVPSFEINAVELCGPEVAMPDEVPQARAPARKLARHAMPPPPRLGTTSDIELDQHVQQAALQRAPTQPDRRHYVPTIDQTNIALARIPTKRLAIGTQSSVPVSIGTHPPPISNTLGEATRAIRCSRDRDAVEALAIRAVAQWIPTTRAALLLVVRGDAAFAHVGFSRLAESLPEVVVPLDEPGLVRDAITRNETMHASARQLGLVDRLVLSAIALVDDDLVVAPISIGVHAVGALVMATERDAVTEHAASITAATGAAFARLMRDAMR